MKTINLRDFYPWYKWDEFVEVSDVIADELFADKRYHKAHKQRTRRNKSFYSLDRDDGIENEAWPYMYLRKENETAHSISWARPTFS